MRYPSPADDPRRAACPLCESPVSEVDSYGPPPEHAPHLQSQPDGSLVAVLDNIRSAQNVGTMLRSSDGIGISHVVLGGLTAPVDNPKVIKTALGADRAVSTTSALDTMHALTQLRRDGYEVWAVDYSARSVPLQSLTQRPEKLALVVGNELAGVDPEILRLAERHVHLDMRGTKSTVNVSVAFGTVAYAAALLPVAPRS
jgi:tRNA G18 (ribose-2'-O)-methylase SpoU